VVTIPKSVRNDGMAENLDAFAFELTNDEMDQIGAPRLAAACSSTTATQNRSPT
jgi:diketogulonate reductase-like aldo/keto reductase